MRIVGSGYDLEEAERNGCCISLALGSPVHFSSLLVIYNLSNAFNTSSAVTFALAGLAPVTMCPPAKAKASPRARKRDIWRSHISIRDSRKCVGSHVAPALAAAATIVGLFQLLIVSSTSSSYSPLVVNPVTFLPAIIDFPVFGSIMPGNIAPP